MCSAAQTNSAAMLGAIANPTTLRENKSSTIAKESQPDPVRIVVISPTQAILGATGLNCRSRMLAAIGRLCAVSGVDEFTLSYWLQACLTHQVTRLSTAIEVIRFY